MRVSSKIEYKKASKEQSDAIARLIMVAMDYDCCRYFCGKHKSLDDFHRMMSRLVAMNDSQYSYLNTIVAMDGDNVVGIAVSYDGARLHHLRQAFIEASKRDLNRDFSNIDDETQAGELYFDSLAVDERYRHQGIATALLKATAERAKSLGLPKVGLLVDQGNPKAEALYRSLGYTFANNSHWGGHPMRHLTLNVTKENVQ